MYDSGGYIKGKENCPLKVIDNPKGLGIESKKTARSSFIGKSGQWSSKRTNDAFVKCQIVSFKTSEKL